MKTRRGGGASFQTKIVAVPGYSRSQISVSEIFRATNSHEAFEVEIVPSVVEGEPILYFGLIDFVKEHRVPTMSDNKSQGELPAARGAGIKCLVWDLDNTLWQGILIEDGPQKVRVRTEVVDIIKEADERGILNSIASKNNHEEAMSVLRAYGLEEFFLYPQIRWQPKSKSLLEIARLLNIGVDSLALVDDQVFEREEVRSVLPDAGARILTVERAVQRIRNQDSRNEKT